MLRPHQTVLEGWTSFKSYPKLKELYFYNLVLILIASAPQFAAHETMVNPALALISFIGWMLGFLCFYFSNMAIVPYTMNGWIFQTTREFIKPPSSLWRLFWKTLAITFIAFIPPIVAAVMAGQLWDDGIGGILLGAMGSIAALFWLAYVMIKLYIAIPHFTINDAAPLRSLFSVSEGRFWYITCILGWLFLYGLVLVILFALLMLVLGLIAFLAGPFGGIILGLVAIIIQVTITLVFAFVAAQAYAQIVENKP
jgi:hypothetical protein